MKLKSFLETLRKCYLTQHIDEHNGVTHLAKPSLLELLHCDVTSTLSSIQFLGQKYTSTYQSRICHIRRQKTNKDLPNFKKARYVEMQESITKDWSPPTDQTDVDRVWCFFKPE